MITFYKTIDEVTTPIDAITPNCWVAVTEPTPEDTAYLIDTLGVKPSFVNAALDESETSHVREDDSQYVIFIDSPVAEHEDNAEAALFYTMPVSFIIHSDYIITITQHDSYVLTMLVNGTIENIDTADRTDFILRALYGLASRYIFHLRKIEKLTLESEKHLKSATKNEEILKLLNLQKSLVFFSTALASTKGTLDILRLGKSTPLEEKDIILLDNVQIELSQAAEQATIYANILATMMSAFGSIISNNINSIMKVMTAITIVMAVPNMVFGFYGMNVGLPLPFVGAPIVFTIAIMSIFGAILYRKGFFGE